jgi:hypothetical protein
LQTKTTRITELLRRDNYPDGYRVLCANCNFSRGIHGYCPHEHEGLVEVA